MGPCGFKNRHRRSASLQKKHMAVILIGDVNCGVKLNHMVPCWRYELTCCSEGEKKRWNRMCQFVNVKLATIVRFRDRGRNHWHTLWTVKKNTCECSRKHKRLLFFSCFNIYGNKLKCFLSSGLSERFVLSTVCVSLSCTSIQIEVKCQCPFLYRCTITL